MTQLPIGYRYLQTKNGSIKEIPIYADQVYKLPFWLNLKLKLRRWLKL